MANLPKTSDIAIQIVDIAKEVQNKFDCRTELKMYETFFTLRVRFYVNIANLDVINKICAKADKYHIYSEDGCVCLDLDFYLED